jgi:dipeptide/tripeptide permease
MEEYSTPPTKPKKKGKKQTKLHSLIESVSNEFLGYLINTTIQILVFPFIGLNLSFGLNLFISGIHSFFGVTRIYILRRLFNYKFKKQTKKISFYESLTNIIVGTLITFVAQIYLYPMLGIALSVSSNLFITILYLTITLIRLYILRRYFNKKTKKAHKAAKALKNT